MNSDAGVHRVLQVSNGSDASIYEVVVKIPGISDVILGEVPGKTTLTPDVEVPGNNADQPKRTSVSASFNLLGINFQGTTRIDHVSQEAAPEIQFRDGAGRWWSRDSRGRLQQVKERTFKVSEIKAGMTVFGMKVETVRRLGSRNWEQSAGQKKISSEGEK